MYKATTLQYSAKALFYYVNLLRFGLATSI